MKKTIFLLLNTLSCAFCLSNKITQQPFMFKKSSFNGISSTSNIENYDNNFNNRSVNYEQDAIGDRNRGRISIGKLRIVYE